MSEYIVDWDENLVIDTFSKNSLREEIVRCRDCKSFVKSTNPMSATGYWCVDNDTPRSLDGYCKWGE